MGKIVFLLGGALGASAVYLVNSRRGSKSTASTWTQASSFAQQTAQQVQAQAASAVSTVKDQASSVTSAAGSAASTVKEQASGAASTVSSVAGAAKQKVSRGTPDNPDPDDSTLKDRVETELFRRPEVDKGSINVDVVGGVVELRGQLPTQKDIDTVIADAKGIEHVKDVTSYLHLPGTPAPNKESALDAS